MNRWVLTIAVVLTLGLTACGDEPLIDNPLEDGLFGQGNILDDGLFGSGTIGGGGSGILDPNVTSVLVDESNSTQTVSRTDRFDLTVSGSDNVLTISGDSDIRNMLVSGDRNTIIFESGTKVENLDVTGFNNLFRIPESSGIVVDSDTGSDNTIEIL